MSNMIDPLSRQQAATFVLNMFYPKIKKFVREGKYKTSNYWFNSKEQFVINQLKDFFAKPDNILIKNIFVAKYGESGHAQLAKKIIKDV